MDYIREELLRQQALLVVLLTGQQLKPLKEAEEHSGISPETLREAGTAGERRLPEEAWETAWAQRFRQSISLRQEQLASLEEMEQEAVLRQAALTAGSAEEQWRSPEQERLQAHTARRSSEAHAAAVRMGYGPAGGFPAEEGRHAGIFPAGTGGVRLVTELYQTGCGEAADPAALSRAFQRDARRYDGGFRLY